MRHPEPGHRFPVVYITVAPEATPRMVAAEFARFLGLPFTARHNLADITNAVCAVLCDVGCELVLVDEIHNLNLATRAGAEVSDQLKYFSERIPATFVYAGIDVERANLFAGTRRTNTAVVQQGSRTPTTPSTGTQSPPGASCRQGSLESPDSNRETPRNGSAGTASAS
ncbi:TniB family NTP-binding protein [Amycolatopsis sp. NPDC050768]|uniref:TniB family NTP-binding protein n=1 Tax=Amycolatopsis sp. NPDC050768 TaxID=3154839 RepID=UPI003406729D